MAEATPPSVPDEDREHAPFGPGWWTVPAEPWTLPQDEFDLVRQIAEHVPDPRAVRYIADLAAQVEARDGTDWKARAEAAEATLAEIRQVIKTYFVVHGNSTSASLTHARDLAEGIRQILDRNVIGNEQGTTP